MKKPVNNIPKFILEAHKNETNIEHATPYHKIPILVKVISIDKKLRQAFIRYDENCLITSTVKILDLYPATIVGKLFRERIKEPTKKCNIPEFILEAQKTNQKIEYVSPEFGSEPILVLVHMITGNDVMVLTDKNGNLTVNVRDLYPKNSVTKRLRDKIENLTAELELAKIFKLKYDEACRIIGEREIYREIMR